MALIPPFFVDCVLAIGSPGGMGVSWTGTGFLYAHVTSRAGDQITGSVFLVTNKHVVEGRVEAVLRCNPSGIEPAREFNLPLLRDDKSPAWTGHPNADIDVAVVPINFEVLRDEGMQVAAFLNDQHVLTRSGLRESEVSEGDHAFVLGFPMALVGGDRSFVIVRGGHIARIRDCTDGVNDEFLVDAQVFPGNSGGPVILAPQALAITGTKAHSSAELIGIVKAYVPYQDVAISQQTLRPRVIFEENTGLAAAHPVDFIDETVRLALDAHPAIINADEDGADETVSVDQMTGSASA